MAIALSRGSIAEDWVCKFNENSNNSSLGISNINIILLFIYRDQCEDEDKQYLVYVCTPVTQILFNKK